MTLLRTSNLRAALACYALAGCRMDNPAFGDDELGASESAGETLGTTDTGESGSSTSDATTTATSDPTSDPTSDATSDATSDTSDSTEGSEGIEPDMMGENVCDAIFAPPYPVVYGVPEVFDGNACPVVVDHYVKLTGPGPAAGLVMVQRCPNGCGAGCGGESYPIGVVGLSSFADPIVEFAAQQPIMCLHVQTGPSYGLDDARCGYASMWIGGVLPSTVDLLVAQHQPGQLPVGAGAAFNGNPPPTLGADKTVCACETAFANADVACCLESMLEAYSSTLVFAGSEVEPGEETVVGLGIGEWRFSVAQAQKYPACDVEPLGVSWALAREL
jgi:hypothetical protein